MRKESEKKSITKSFKITKELFEKVDYEAKKNNMNFSQYVVDCIEHRDSAKLNPKIMVALTEITNCARRCVINNGDLNDYNKLEMEVKKLWESVK